jgi:hypothetical protein
LTLYFFAALGPYFIQVNALSATFFSAKAALFSAKAGPENNEK